MPIRFDDGLIRWESVAAEDKFLAVDETSLFMQQRMEFAHSDRASDSVHRAV